MIQRRWCSDPHWLCAGLLLEMDPEMTLAVGLWWQGSTRARGRNAGSEGVSGCWSVALVGFPLANHKRDRGPAPPCSNRTSGPRSALTASKNRFKPWRSTLPDEASGQQDLSRTARRHEQLCWLLAANCLVRFGAFRIWHLASGGSERLPPPASRKHHSG